MFEQFYQYTISYFQQLADIPFNYGDRFYFVYVLTFIGFAYFAYRRYYPSATPFWRFLFPRSIYLHKSAITDYGIYLVNLFIAPATALFGAALNTWVTTIVAQNLVALNSNQALFVGEWNNSIGILFILGFTLAADLAVYIVHRVHHRSDVLWPIHALHHSAEVLTPVTLFRKHPLWNFTANLMTAALTGLFQGVFVFVYFGQPNYSMLLGINTFYAAFNFFASNLRHSHVWLSWGKPLSYLFISPAMHQIHHDPTRMNKNYGEIFAIWDWMFGSLYIPNEREEFDIGLPEGNPHNSLLKAYTVPVIEMARQIRCKLTGLVKA